ncbi:uncharacterized protein EI90DRAFT_3288264 [Cantharellus anzutake]|uniref:uncharacterized protein n=1 Tax=Cantharellus anzutake TaxID=1750568 RepID=UPI001906BBB5|nr:uncharacterized protein EI90DRAFT_3288264 [Cantharellus anzutake]KAF8333969.1 hypothetical protein EI90DRAFT_3288264 [Cantharellus anzutake]
MVHARTHARTLLATRGGISSWNNILIARIRGGRNAENVILTTCICTKGIDDRAPKEFKKFCRLNKSNQRRRRTTAGKEKRKFEGLSRHLDMQMKFGSNPGYIPDEPDRGQGDDVREWKHRGENFATTGLIMYGITGHSPSPSKIPCGKVRDNVKAGVPGITELTMSKAKSLKRSVFEAAV